MERREFLKRWVVPASPWLVRRWAPSGSTIRGAELADYYRCVEHNFETFIFSIPKILRSYFLYERKLLVPLSRCA